ncbi:MerR family transcriptional regulator [Paenibacillus sp. GCM10027627]|uniref:MerR family transcriptional regulator n=1 Tax=unclassified Paenibacillus TaxID=185978 RepID=UPI0036438112
MERGHKEKTYPIGEFAKLTGVTERTLRFYDRKELLRPTGRNAQGHRFYNESDLVKLQRILTLKYLDYSLEDIAGHFQKKDVDFQQSLTAQYALLKQKQKQLERVLNTIERLQESLAGNGQVERDLLLMLIHSIQNEESQKQYFAEHMSEAVVQIMFMEGVPEEAKREYERKMTGILIEIVSFCKAGRSPSDPEVLEVGHRMLELMKETLGPGLSQLNEEQLQQLEMEIEKHSESFDPSLIRTGLGYEEENFLLELANHLEKISLRIGGQPSGD